MVESRTSFEVVAAAKAEPSAAALEPRASKKARTIRSLFIRDSPFPVRSTTRLKTLLAILP
jgi:hypothetical protein